MMAFGDDLGVTARAVIAFERLRWRYAGSRDQTIVDLFDVTPTRHAQRVNALLGTAAALTYDPRLLHRPTGARTRGRARTLP